MVSAAGCKKSQQNANGPAMPQTTEAPAKSADAAQESCRAFVQDFYDWYVKAESSPNNKIGSFSLAQARPHAISAGLQKLLDADYRASESDPDEIVGLDFDPFLNTQDPSTKFTVQDATIKDGRCIAEVRGMQNGVPMESVNPELDQAAGTWEFINFHYPAAGPKESDHDLLSILRQLSADRSKIHK